MLRIRLILFLAAVILLPACNYVEHKPPVGNPVFDSILRDAERMADAGNYKEGYGLVVDAHKKINNLSVQDEMNYYSYIGGIYFKFLKDYNRYVATGDSIIAILDQNPKIPGYTDKYYILAYNIKADGMFSNGMYNESYEYYYKSKSLAEQSSDSCSLSYFTYNLAMVQYRQQKYLDAAALFKQSLIEAQSCSGEFGHFYHSQELLDNIGLSYSAVQMYDSALLYYHKAIAYIDANYMRHAKSEHVYITAKAVVYGNMGNVYLALKQYDTASKLLNQSIAINLQKGYTNEDALLDQVKLATLYYNTGQMPLMKQLLDNIKAEMDTIPNKNVPISWNRLMWNYYEHEGDSMQAYRYARAYILKKDSFLVQNKSLMSMDIAGRIRGLERQNHIDLLKKNNEQERLYLIIAIIIAVMALVIVGLVLRNAIKTRKNLAKLTDLNNKVNEQNERLELALDGLEEKDKDKSRILRSVAHDVINPIAAIMSLTDIIISEADQYSDEHKEMLELIKEACNNSLSLSRDILQASMKLDPSTLEKEWVDINQLVDGSVKLLGIQAGAKHQKIVVTAHNTEVKAFVNKKKIWRVINNLLGNAIKFSYENAEIEVHIVIILDKVHISIIDKGIGIPEKNQAHVFDMFTEARSVGTAGERPHGLGLSISLQIAKAHKGNIWFESEYGKGTTFHLVLPLKSDS